MKKHLLVILFVACLLAGTYFVGHRVSTATKSNSSQTSNNQKSGSSQPKPNSTSSFNKSQFSLTDPTSIWVVVNKQRPLNPKTYTPADLISIGNGQKMRNAAAVQLTKLFTAAKTAGYTLVAESGYRSYSYQVGVYSSEVHSFGQAKADTESARPGYSEHQTGWAVDIGSPGCYEDCFSKKPASQWVLANAYTYGFILRYPSNKSTITGYRNEPWHFRYVGVSLATEMHKQNALTLEEFFALPPAPNY